MLSSVQLLSRARLLATPWIAARQACTTQSDLPIYAIPIKISVTLVTETENPILGFSIWNIKGTPPPRQSIQNHLEKGQSWRSHIPWLQTSVQSYSNQTAWYQHKDRRTNCTTSGLAGISWILHQNHQQNKTQLNWISLKFETFVQRTYHKTEKTTTKCEKISGNHLSH